MLRKKFDGLFLNQLILSISVLSISIYSKATDTYELIPLMLILLSAIFIFISIREYKRSQKYLSGIIYLFVSLLMLFVALERIIL